MNGWISFPFLYESKRKLEKNVHQLTFEKGSSGINLTSVNFTITRSKSREKIPQSFNNKGLDMFDTRLFYGLLPSYMKRNLINLDYSLISSYIVLSYCNRKANYKSSFNFFYDVVCRKLRALAEEISLSSALKSLCVRSNLNLSQTNESAREIGKVR